MLWRLKDKVSSDLENPEMSGNFDARRKSQGIVRKFYCMKFIFSQSEHPHFENFLGDHAPRAPLTVFDTHKNLIVVWKSQGISSILETGDPEKRKHGISTKHCHSF